MTPEAPDRQAQARSTDTGPVQAPRPGGESRELADVVVETVLAVPGVVEMHQGMYGEVASYLPGRKVSGVQIRDDECHVHVVMVYDADIRTTADAIRAAVEPIVSTRVHVTIQDLVDENPREGGQGRADQS